MRRPLHFCIRAKVGAAAEAERVVAEVWAAGAAGVEERPAADGIDLLIYAPAGSELPVQRAAESIAGTRIAPVEAVAEVDWSVRWRAGLAPIEISPRLVVRPSFVRFNLSPGQGELVVDPGRAFGTGGHASTRLALEWIDSLCDESGPPARVLDVGTGTGVLALAALRLGAGWAVGLDIDVSAVCEARRCAQANDLDQRLLLLSGSTEALAGSRFDLVVANLLRLELLPLAAKLAALTAVGGHLVVSGLLGTEAQPVENVLVGLGFAPARIRHRDDPTGDRWASLLLRRRGDVR